MMSSEEHKDFSNKNNFEFEYLPIKARSTSGEEEGSLPSFLKTNTLS